MLKGWPVYTKSLILVHQPGCQDVGDFQKIANYVREISSDIEPFIVNNELRCSVTRKRAAKNPSLIFSPGALNAFRPDRGKIYAGRPISKLKQMEQFRANGIPVPEYAELTQDLDVIQFGEIVLVKGTTIHASRSVGTELRRSKNVSWQPCDSYPEDHPGRYGPMFVQKFIDTGEYASHYRVLTLFGEPLLAYRNVSTMARCDLDASDADLQNSVIRASRKTGQTKELTFDPDLIDMAKKTYDSFPDVPLQACDFIREEKTGKIYLLEINPGGNTWSFSRERTPLVLQELGIADLTVQFDAFRRAAQLLVEKTRREAL